LKAGFDFENVKTMVVEAFYNLKVLLLPLLHLAFSAWRLIQEAKTQ
jgi:hypothetical protein